MLNYTQAEIAEADFRSNAPIQLKLLLLAQSREYVQERWPSAHNVYRVIDRRTNHREMAVALGEIVLDMHNQFVGSQDAPQIISDWYDWPYGKGDWLMKVTNLALAWRDAFGFAKYKLGEKAPEFDWLTEYQLHNSATKQ